MVFGAVVVAAGFFLLAVFFFAGAFLAPYASLPLPGLLGREPA